MTREELQHDFHNEQGINWLNSQGEPDIDYVMWLENKILAIKNNTPLPPAEGAEEYLKLPQNDGKLKYCPAHFFPTLIQLMEGFAAQPQPTAEGAEEIIESIVESLGEPMNIHNHIFEIRPYTVEHKTEWWIFHKEVRSGEPLAQWLGKFATLHAQRLAEKMMSERLREELIKFCRICISAELIGDEIILVDQYLNARSHETK